MYGEIDTLYNILSLSKVDLSANYFTGELEEFVGDVVYMDVSNNAFEGSANFVTDLSSAYYVNLANNNFDGNVPDFSQLLDLEKINLSNNNFTGSLQPLQKLTKLKVRVCTEFVQRQRDDNFMTGDGLELQQHYWTHSRYVKAGQLDIHRHS